jgi:hypothetical protein
MLGQSEYSRAMLPNVREIERRLRSLEQQLERVGDRTSASTAEVVERAAAAIAPGVEQHRRSVSWRRPFHERRSG